MRIELERLRRLDPVWYRFILVDGAGRIVDTNAYGKAIRWSFAQRRAAEHGARCATAALGFTVYVESSELETD